MTVSIPATSFTAGSTQTATGTLTNSSDATVTVGDILRFAIFDAQGQLVYQSIPAYPQFISEGTPLGPKESITRQHAFRVPSAGSYTMEVTEVNGSRFTQPPAVGFESVP